MKKLIVFDVNETLLDLKALDPHFERVCGKPGGAYRGAAKDPFEVGV